MARVAVITRTKDRPLMLPRARESIENQDFRDFTWVLVNDAGEREYVEAAGAAAHDKGVEVKIIHRTESKGMEAASNAGIRSLDSEYVVIHDDDDSWEPDFLSKMTAFLQDHDEFAGVVSLSNYVFETIGKGGIKEIKRMPYPMELGAIQIANMLVVNCFAPIAFLFRRSLYDAVGGFDETLPVLGDWDFNLRALLKGDIGVFSEALANYHIRNTVANSQVIYGNSVTAGVDIHKIQEARYRNLKLREDLNNGVIGLGFLLCQARQMHSLKRHIDYKLSVSQIPRKVLNKFRIGFSAIKRTFTSL